MFFDDSRPDRRKRANREAGFIPPSLENSPIPPAKQYEVMTPYELISGGSRTLFYDVESYPNYFLVSFKCHETKKIIFFEDSPDAHINIELLIYVLHRFRLVGFNSNSYDMIMTLLAAKGLPAWKLKEVSNQIINEELPPYQSEKIFGVNPRHINHIDLIEVAPLSASLKIYGGRLHAQRMQELPFHHLTNLTKEQAIIVRDYNVNDLDVTELLFDALATQIKLREELGSEYGLDLRSKSDAQIAEAVIASELAKLGTKGKKVELPHDWKFNYQVPHFMEFKTPVLQQLLEFVRIIPFELSPSGKPKFPHNLQELAQPFPLLKVIKKEKDGKRSFAIEIKFGGNKYTVAMGGLHTCEEKISHYSNNEVILIDRDVESYYPAIILTQGLYPQHLGEAFLRVFRTIVNRRVHAKRTGDKKTSDSLKITINGTFGKLGNMFSDIYAPDLLTQVTISGQLCLLMYIERLFLANIPVVSANTDGVVAACPRGREDDLLTCVIAWEEQTGFVTEETRYRSLHSRDVNNYIAIKEDGEVKTKGTYSERGSALNSPLSKNPETLICSDAVQKFLLDGTPITETVYNCKDIRRFISLRTVKGGAYKNGVHLGKAIRWYYALGEEGTIDYIATGNKVPKSEGAKPYMNFEDQLPNDIDLDWYVNEANDMLFDLGYYVRPGQATLFS